MSDLFNTEILDEKADIFIELNKKKYPWWENIKNYNNDPENNNKISIQIRQNNYIDVYFNGGALIKELKYSDKYGFTASIHHKYIPLVKGSTYRKFNLCSDGVSFKKKPEILEFSQFELGI